MKTVKIDSQDMLKEHFPQKLIPGAYTNMSFEMDKYRAAADAGKLFAVESDGGTFLLKDRDGFFTLHFYTWEQKFPTVPDNTVTEITFRPGKKDSTEITEILLSAGFVKKLGRVRLSRKTGNLPFCDESVTRADATSAAEVAALFQKCFDRVTGCLPDTWELAACAECGGVFTVVDGGSTVGAIQADIEKGYSFIRHLAVLPEYRGRGLGERLVGSLIGAANGIRSMVWAVDDNVPALRVYEKCGYVPDGYTSVVYVKGKI